ncbi:hypothetical protein, partial [Streptococcus pneumoniae]|uniref:hypothetical protein n=1 Tax=Streptococcus pneumoniae TaxID=1313 RepID=UPI0018B08AE7
TVLAGRLDAELKWLEAVTASRNGWEWLYREATKEAEKAHDLARELADARRLHLRLGDKILAGHEVLAHLAERRKPAAGVTET